MKLFNLSKNCTIVCKTENTSYGFRHLATLFLNGHEVENSKAVYYNRTWEAYQYQTVLYKIVEKCKELTKRQKTIFCKKIKTGIFN